MFDFLRRKKRYQFTDLDREMAVTIREENRLIKEARLKHLKQKEDEELEEFFSKPRKRRSRHI